jgi:RNA-directed DNA polymerase
MVMEDGTQAERSCGTPQGGVVSPLLANLFLHYAFDLWMARTHPDLRWCRYADDGLVHCRTEQEAQAVRAELQARLAECHLEMHPTKTKIVYCKDGSRKGKYPNVSFDFLGYCFRPRVVKNSRRGTLFWSFTPAVSRAALTAMQQAIRETNFRNRTQIGLEDIARQLNPVLRGWMEYYGRFSPSALYPVFRQVNKTLVAWAMRKYKHLAGHKTRASLLLESIAERNPRLFAHWRNGTVGAFA